MIYSKVITYLKLFFIATSILLLGVLVLYSFSDKKISFDMSVVPSGDYSKVDNNYKARMVNPTLTGMDKNNNPFNIMAREAVQNEKDEVVLDRINANFTLDNDTLLLVSADHGIYKTKKKNLRIYGDVSVSSDGDYLLNLEDISINIDDNFAYSNSYVKIHAPIGKLYASNFKFYANEQKILFSGGVKVVLH